MTLAEARKSNINRVRKPSSLRRVAQTLLTGNEEDRRDAQRFADRAAIIERIEAR